MKIVPILRCPNLKEAVAFYTTIFDFTLKYPDEKDSDWVVTLINDEQELLLTSMDGTPRTSVLVHVDDVDAVYRKCLERGLQVPNNPDSPVHDNPIDQTWGLREFYVNDPAGNTLRFATPIG